MIDLRIINKTQFKARQSIRISIFPHPQQPNDALFRPDDIHNQQRRETGVAQHTNIRTVRRQIAI
jgi:hypothetical protein